jgi:hypothetical protein
MFADDIANSADTATKLQQQPKVVNHLRLNTGMEINLYKHFEMKVIILGLFVINP